MAEPLSPEELDVRRAALERRTNDARLLLRDEAYIREIRSIEDEGDYLATIDARDARIEALEDMLRGFAPRCRSTVRSGG